MKRVNERDGEWAPGSAEPSLVRPYTLTAGRTEPAVALPWEAPIRTRDLGPAPRWPGNDVRARILELGRDSPSVAEIAARLSLPLGVARVLIGDLVAQGYLRVHGTLADAASTDERRELIGRTLRGLRAL
ncbi:DUF742 domain-containing protein [Mycobacterium sp. BMJ-28]